MPDPRTDEIAREAARLIQTGRAETIDNATRLAADSLGYSHALMPGHGRVRKHAQAMSMQALGEEAYEQERARVWQVAEQVMTVFEHVMPEATTMLVGRAAQGLIDAGVTIHIRIYTRRSEQQLARTLQDFGYEGLAFVSVETRFGRMQQIRFEDDGHEVALTRCVPEMVANVSTGLDLTDLSPIATITLEALRRRIDSAK
jgi:hypothetical protein